MRNCYLRINELPGGKFKMTYCDGIFIAAVAVTSKEKLDSYYDKKAVQWETYHNNVSEEDRQVIAEKWRKAKQLPAGNYEYYFNLFSNPEDLKPKEEEIKRALIEFLQAQNVFLDKINPNVTITDAISWLNKQ